MALLTYVTLILLLLSNINQMYSVEGGIYVYPVEGDNYVYPVESVIYDNVQFYLINGSGPSEGRVEIDYEGIRGTICDFGWSLNNARVICRMLGFVGALGFPGGAAFGPGTADIIYGGCDCDGTEDHLLDCPELKGRPVNCTHEQDAGAICYSEAPFLVRLADGDSDAEGRVELMYNGKWGTICDDSWSIKEAKVVCSMRGFDGALIATRDALIASRYAEPFGPGPWSYDIFLDDVTCQGSEDNLAECSHNGIGVHDCGHWEDAGVICFSGDPFQVRLIDGVDDAEGRVEILYEGSWGTVCDDNWDLKDARVVCRMLGFVGALAAPRAAAYSQGSGEILLDNVGCDGTEDKLADCNHRGIGVHNCGHAQDAGVRCYMGSDPFPVRLVGGKGDSHGRVEVLYQGSWGTICDEDWDIRDATVVCRMLDFDGALDETRSARFGMGSGDCILGGVRCRGTEGHLAECLHGEFGSQVCGYEKNAVAICYFNVRLVGGANDAEGRVEIKYQGKWGTVCHDQWDILDATVLCRMLGFPGALKALGSAHFGKGTGAIFLDDVQCKGTESRLTECSHKRIGVHNCAHNEDASAVCNTEELTLADDTMKGKIIGGVLGTIAIGLLLIIIGVTLYCRRKKRKEKDQEDPTPFAVSETTGTTKDPAHDNDEPMDPPKLPKRSLTLPLPKRKQVTAKDDLKKISRVAPSAVKDDETCLSFNLESDAPEAATAESVYLGDEVVVAMDAPVTDDNESVHDAKL